MIYWQCNQCGLKGKSPPSIVHCTCGNIFNTKGYETEKPFGPGTELTKLIPEILKSENCGCKQYALQMDKWGVVGCEKRFDEIVEHLLTQSRKIPLIGRLTTFNRCFAKKWLREAIDMCKPPAQDINGNWYIAITTSPRKDCTLEQCVNSLRACGWEPTIFAEPDSTIINANYHWNEKRLGAWHNWLNSVKVALQSDAELIMTVQDDSLFHPDSRTFTESILWPSKTAGFVSLYTPKHYTIDRRGKWRNVGINQISTSSLWGACALVWSREILEALIKLPRVNKWLGARPKSKNQEVYKNRAENPHKIANVDTVIGMAIADLQKTMWFIDPSPVSHIAEYSTLAHGGNEGRRNAIRIADHNLSLRSQVFPHENSNLVLK